MAEDYSSKDAQTVTSHAMMIAGRPDDLSRSRRRSEDIVERSVDGELIIYDLVAQVIHVLNPTAGLVWDLCDDVHSRTEIASVLAEHFEVDPCVVEEDVRMILQSFAIKGLLEVSASDVIRCAE